MAEPERSIPMLSEADEARLQASIANNPDSREPSSEMLARMRPASEVLPPAFYAAVISPRGRLKTAAGLAEKSAGRSEATKP